MASDLQTIGGGTGTGKSPVESSKKSNFTLKQLEDLKLELLQTVPWSNGVRPEVIVVEVDKSTYLDDFFPLFMEETQVDALNRPVNQHENFYDDKRGQSLGFFHRKKGVNPRLVANYNQAAQRPGTQLLYARDGSVRMQEFAVIIEQGRPMVALAQLKNGGSANKMALMVDPTYRDAKWLQLGFAKLAEEYTPQSHLSAKSSTTSYGR